MSSPIQSQSAGGIVTCAGDILLVCENGNFWGFPKGRIEQAETDLQAAEREITEETGLLPTDFSPLRERPIGTYQRHPFTLENKLDTSELKTITMFLFHAPSRNLGAPHEANTKGQWFSKDEVAAQLTHPQDLEFYLRVEHLL